MYTKSILISTRGIPAINNHFFVHSNGADLHHSMCTVSDHA